MSSTDVVPSAVLNSGTHWAMMFIFASSAATKLMSPARFGRALSDYALLPYRYLAPMTWAVPVAELAVGVAWIAPVNPLVAFAGTVILCGLFIGAVTAALRTGGRHSCGCGGVFRESAVGPSVIVRNVGIVVMAAVPLVMARGAAGAAPLPWAGVATLPAAAVFIVGIVWLDAFASLVDAIVDLRRLVTPSVLREMRRVQRW